MKIATYNIWNEDKNFGERSQQIIGTVCSVQADIIGLQEVPPHFYEQHLSQTCGYPYCQFRQYPGEEEGLAVLSRYLLGEQTLNGQEAAPYWFEVSSTYTSIQGLPLLPTLDFTHNPRWNGKNTTEIPYTADRIYVMYGRGNDTLEKVELFGTEISQETGLAPSDHYGVAANIVFHR